MRGEVDNSVTAILLQKSGHDVTGITFIFTDLDEQNPISIKVAKELAYNLNFKHYVVDLRDEFKSSVIRYFIQDSAKGNTPFPCAYCNPNLKFNYLKKQAEGERCSYISTGHYVKIRPYRNKKYIWKGIDSDKDQSFILWG